MPAKARDITANGHGYCPHNRIAESCEDCAYERAQAAGLPLGGPPPAATREQVGRSPYDPEAG
jgi:hypothetical protein